MGLLSASEPCRLLRSQSEALDIAFVMVEQADRNGNRLAIDRNLFGGIRRLVEPSGRALTVTLAGLRQITTITDPLGRTVRYGYDPDGRLTTVTDPAGGVTRYA